MHALILAAGTGSRSQQRRPKCLLKVGGRPLLHHQMNALDEVGADQITLVLGYQWQRVETALRGRGQVILNERYAITNSLYSFWLARDAIDGDVLVMNGDVLFDPALLRDLLEVEGSALAYDTTSGDDPEHMKVRTRNGRLLRMSKDLPPMHNHGENVGIVHLREPAARAAALAADQLVRQGRGDDWVSAVFTEVAPRHSITCLDVAGRPWVEIDFPHDLEHARTSVWPAIEHSMNGRRVPDFVRARPRHETEIAT
jgi:L-glutamine-phosphate cytidylyltransferase